MNYYLKMDKKVEMALRTYEALLSQLDREFKRAEENYDTEEMTKIAYDINTITEAYESLRADNDSYYKRSLFFRDELREAISNDEMGRVLDIAKKLGHKQSDIARELCINDGNLSACKKGSRYRLSKIKRDMVYDYVWRLAN